MLDESVSTALLVVLESMTPAERVAFVLHDVFAVPFGEIARSWVADPTVTLCSDGGVVRAALHRITGVANVARSLMSVLAKQPNVRLVQQQSSDGLAFALTREDEVTGLVTIMVDGDLITRVWIRWNPSKLIHWVS